MRSRLDKFCIMMLSKYGEPGGVAPGDLAQEFINHADLSSFPSFMELYAKLRSYGVKEITDAELPDRLKGHHFQYRGRYTIEYEANSWGGRADFTIGHELFEMIHETFENLVPHYRRALRDGTPCMGIPANRFSAALWMQSQVFTQALFSSGFNLVQLRHRFEKSYATVGIRAIDVVNQWNSRVGPDDKVGFLVAIYERQEPASDLRAWGNTSFERFVVGYLMRTHGIKVGKRGGARLANGNWSRANYRAQRYPAHLMPRKGDGVVPGSVAARVIEGKHPVFIDRVWGYDLWGFNDLSVLGVPVEWYGKLAKVVVVAMKRSHSKFLEPSIQVLEPQHVEDSFQIL